MIKIPKMKIAKINDKTKIRHSHLRDIQNTKENVEVIEIDGTS